MGIDVRLMSTNYKKQKKNSQLKQSKMKIEIIEVNNYWEGWVEGKLVVSNPVRDLVVSYLQQKYNYAA